MLGFFCTSYVKGHLELRTVVATGVLMSLVRLLAGLTFGLVCIGIGGLEAGTIM